MLFEAYSATPTGPESKLFVMPTTGGPPEQITDGKHFDDKPRWSADGKAIYFLSDRDGFFNIWAMSFDNTKGGRVGSPERVTRFDSPSVMIPKTIGLVELSLSKEALIINLEESSGAIWLLSGVGK